MSRMSDQDDLQSGFEMPFRLDVNLRYERAGRIEIEEFAFCSFFRDRFRDPMSRKDNRRIGVRNLAQLLDEDRSFRFQAFNHGAVVNDFMPDVDRRPKFLNSHLHDLDCPVDARTKSPWRGEQHIEVWFCRHRGHLQDLTIEKGVRNSAKRSNLAG